MRRLIISVVVAAVVAGCGQAQPATILSPGPMQEAQPTSNKSPSPSAIGITETSTSTATPLPTATPYLTPTTVVPTLNHDGPWLVFNAIFDDPYLPYGRGAFAAINADGSGLTALTEGEDGGYGFMVSPVGSVASGIDIAYIGFAADDQGNQQFALKLLHLPDRTIRTMALIGIDDGHTYAGNLLWSHDGRRIAYRHGQYSKTMDLSIYSLDTGKVIRILKPHEYVFSPRWSPDDQTIVYGAVDDYSSSGPEPLRFGLWASRTDGTGNPVEIEPLKDSPKFYGWRDTRTALTGYIHGVNDSAAIREVNVETGESEIILEGTFYQADYDTEDDVFLTWTCDFLSNTTTGLELIGPDIHETVYHEDVTCGQAVWNSQTQAFFLTTDPSTDWGLMISPEGKVKSVTRPNKFFDAPDVSDSGRYWAWYSHHQYSAVAEVWVSDPDGENARLVFNDTIINLLWVPGSDAFFFSTTDGIFRAAAPGFKPERVVTYQKPGEPMFNVMLIVP